MEDMKLSVVCCLLCFAIRQPGRDGPTMKIANGVIDRFVEFVNQKCKRQPRSFANMPASVRIGKPNGDSDKDEFTESDWGIFHHNGIDWALPLEEEIGIKFPLTYCALIMRYIFPAFEIYYKNNCSIFLWGNTPEGTDHFELRTWHTEKKEIISDELLKRGFLQIGNPTEEGNFDAVCFDLRQQRGNNDCPLVWIYHEALWINKKIQIAEKVADSFQELLEMAMSNPRNNSA